MKKTYVYCVQKFQRKLRKNKNLLKTGNLTEEFCQFAGFKSHKIKMWKVEKWKWFHQKNYNAQDWSCNVLREFGFDSSDFDFWISAVF